MLIHIILILCLQLMKFGECIDGTNSADFFDRKWNWKNACKKHPLAIDAEAVENKMDPSIGKTCALKFDYAVDEGDDARAEFCRAMFPDQLRSSNMEGSDKIACVYQRTYACSGNNNEFLIGSKCLRIASKPMSLENAKTTCHFGSYKLFSPEDGAELLAFLTRLYSFDQQAPTLWTFDNEVAAQYYLKYSAIGNHRPGETVQKTGEELNEEAMAVCVRKADSLPGVKQDYCHMLSSFFKMKTFETGEKIKTCYMVTPSVMVGKTSKANKKLVTIDHFNTICKANHENLDFPVAPRSKAQAAALIGLKQGLLLPGSMNIALDQVKAADKNDVFDKLSDKEDIASRFMYITSRHDTKTEMNNQGQSTSYKIVERETAAVPVDEYWPNPSKESKLNVNPGILYWNKKGHIENVEQFRRAPIVCGSGPSVVSSFKCEDGWEMAYRGDKALCFRVADLRCPSYAEAVEKCSKDFDNSFGKSYLAPVKSAEEESAILRAMANQYGEKLVEKNGVLVGGYADLDEKAGNKKPFYWADFFEGTDKKAIGTEYKRWQRSQPDHARKCPNAHNEWLIFYKEGDCYYENCVELNFVNGKSIGLNDVVCKDACHSRGIDSIACAKWAQPVVNSDE